MVDHESFQGENDLSGVGLPRTGLCAESTVQAFPELVGIFQDPLPCTDLDVADHLAGKVFVEQRADGGTGTAVEAGQGRILSVFHQLLCKIRIERNHG